MNKINIIYYINYHMTGIKEIFKRRKIYSNLTTELANDMNLPK